MCTVFPWMQFSWTLRSLSPPKRHRTSNEDAIRALEVEERRQWTMYIMHAVAALALSRCWDRGCKNYLDPVHGGWRNLSGLRRKGDANENNI